MLDKYTKLYKNEAEFCRQFGIKQQFLVQIKQGKRPIPPKLALSLNKKHGAILHEIRPDIYPKN